jgi:hypothetical protein
LLVRCDGEGVLGDSRQAIVKLDTGVQDCRQGEVRSKIYLYHTLTIMMFHGQDGLCQVRVTMKQGDAVALVAAPRCCGERRCVDKEKHTFHYSEALFQHTLPSFARPVSITNLVGFSLPREVERGLFVSRIR